MSGYGIDFFLFQNTFQNAIFYIRGSLRPPLDFGGEILIGLQRALMEEFYGLSPNSELFESLRNGDHELSRKLVESPTSVLEKVNNHLIVLLTQNDGAKLEQYLANLNSEDDKVLVYGECILAMTATTKDEQKLILRKILEPFLQVTPLSNTFVRARREWLCILLNELEKSNVGNTFTADKILNLRFVIASWTDNCRPGLVGESFYMAGKAALDVGDTDKARQCFQSVRNDMKINLQKDLPSNLRFEVLGILHWYRKSCEALEEMDGSLSTQIEREIESLDKKFPNSTTFDDHAAIMIGPIAKTYLSRENYLKKLLKEICKSDCCDTSLEPVCHRYDYCHEIDDILFAIERHRAVLPLIPNTVQLSYEPNIQEILDVLKILENDG